MSQTLTQFSNSYNYPNPQQSQPKNKEAQEFIDSYNSSQPVSAQGPATWTAYAETAMDWLGSAEGMEAAGTMLQGIGSVFGDNTSTAWRNSNPASNSQALKDVLGGISRI